MNKSVIITGVAGLLGSNLADYILRRFPEYTVVGIDNLFGGLQENVNGLKENHRNFIFIKSDVEDVKLMEIFLNFILMIYLKQLIIKFQ